MSRRTVLLGCLFAATSLTSTGCHGMLRPWLWRCGGCWPHCYTPASSAPVAGGPVMAAPVVAAPVIPNGGAECACFSPPSGPIAVSAPPPVAGPAFNVLPPTYGVPTYPAPPVVGGQPSSPLGPPQVMKENPMPAGGMK